MEWYIHAPSSGMPGVMIIMYAPMFAIRSTRIPRMVPSFITASSTSWSWSRPWWVAWAFSERVSTHLTGRPSSSATTAAMVSSR